MKLTAAAIALLLLAACATDLAPASDAGLTNRDDTAPRQDTSDFFDDPTPDPTPDDPTPDVTPPPPCPTLLDPSTCEASACRWSLCGLCEPTSRPTLCDTRPCDVLDPGTCGVRTDCRWFECASACADATLADEVLCPPTCDDQARQYDCQFNLDGCRWDECDRRCREVMEPFPPCAPSQGPCGDNQAIPACDTDPDGCAWYACVERCYPNTSSLGLVCGQGSCVTYQDPTSCTTNARCQWISRADGCYETGARQQDVCR